MSRQKKPKSPTIKGKRDGHNKRRVTLDNHPSQVSGMFKDDPTFEEFREILRQQREDDLKLANEEISRNSSNDGVFEPGEAIATLTGNLIDGTPIEGTDTICIVGPPLAPRLNSRSKLTTTWARIKTRR